MHILYIHQHFATPADSIGTRSYELSRRLVDAGHKVTMLCGDTVGRTNAEDGRIKKEIVDGINIVRITEPYANNMGFLSRIFSFLKFAYSATMVARGEKPDLIYATSTPLTVGIPAMISQRKTAAPFVFEVRDLWPTLPVAMGAIKNPVIIWLLRLLEKTIYKRSDAIVTLAPGMETEIRKTKGTPELIEFIPNACDTELFNPSAATQTQSVNFDSSRFNLVYCGHHGIANGLDALIDTALELQNRGESAVQFVMVGKGSEKERLVRKSVEERVSDYFLWSDPIPKTELASLLPSMDAGLMPLMNVTAFHNGTSPNKFFDYISSGLPVITNYPGWIANLITEHQCGEVVEPDNPADLADAIVTMKNTNNRELEKKGRSSRNLAETHFARSALGEKFVQILEDIHSRNT